MVKGKKKLIIQSLASYFHVLCTYRILPWIMLRIKLTVFFLSASSHSLAAIQVPRLFLHPFYCFFYRWPAAEEWAKCENVKRDFMFWENWKCFSHFGAVVVFYLLTKEKRSYHNLPQPSTLSEVTFFCFNNTTLRHSPETGLWEMFIQPLLAFVIFSRYRHYQRNTRALFIHCCVAIPFYFVSSR